MPVLPSHDLSIALMQPQIAPNTGNIARLCVATGSSLHLVRPLGFILSDRNLRRSAMDYWDRLKLTVHDDTDSFLASSPARRFWLFTTKSAKSLWDAKFLPTDCLIFGSETRGLPDKFFDQYPDRTLRIPQAQDERCLNLSTAVGIALYEALRQISK